MIGHLWSLPNTLIGLLFGLGGTVLFDRTNQVFVITGGWMAAIFGRLGYAGMCVGDVVLCAQPLSPGTYRHELIHALQARLLGPLYLPITLLCYLWGFLIFPKNGHDASPLEVWADRASGNAHRNAYLKHRSLLQ
ncbi:MAG: hypothetical protein QM758_16265 [Armatimonas sp.]